MGCRHAHIATWRFDVNEAIPHTGCMVQFPPREASSFGNRTGSVFRMCPLRRVSGVRYAEEECDADYVESDNSRYREVLIVFIRNERITFAIVANVLVLLRKHALAS
jgi:hypothetical protein